MSHARRAPLALLVAVVGLLTATGTASAAATDAPGATPTPDLASFGIAPASPVGPDDRPYLKYTAAPGTVIYDHVAILNQDDQPISLMVYPSEVGTGLEGGMVVPGKDEALTDSGTWIDADVTEVTVPAQTAAKGPGYVIVPFTVTVPAGAEPGDHVGAVVASLLVRGEATGDAPALDLEQRVAARLYITVDGALAPGLVVTDLGADFRPGGLLRAGRVETSYDVTNTGNTRLMVTPSVRVTGPFGWLPRDAAEPVIEELLPGDTVHQSVVVDDVWPLVRLQVAVTAVPGAPAFGGDDPGIGPAVAGVVVWAVPWPLVGLLLLLVGLVTWRLVHRRRRAAKPGQKRRGRHSGRGKDTTSAEGVGPAPSLDPVTVSTQPRSAVLRSPESGPSFT